MVMSISMCPKSRRVKGSVTCGGLVLGGPFGCTHPRTAIEPEGVHHQRGSFPTPDGIAQPSRLGLVGQGAAIQKHLTESGVGGGLIKQNDQRWRLHNFEWVRRVIG